MAALLTPAIAHNLASWAAPMTPAEAGLKAIALQQAIDARRAAGYALVRGERLAGGGLHAAGPVWEDEPDLALLTYWLAEDQQGQGLLSEAVGAALPDFAAHLLQGGFRRMGAAVRPENHVSLRAMGNLGLQTARSPRPYRMRAHGETVEVVWRDAPFESLLGRGETSA